MFPAQPGIVQDRPHAPQGISGCTPQPYIHPNQLADLIGDLKKLDKQALANISGIVKGLIGEK
jgi:hypothetical protein